MAYGKYKHLSKKAQSCKVSRGKAFKIESNPEYDGYQRGLASIVFKLFDKKSTGACIKSMSNQQLATELHKPIIKKKITEEKFILHLKTIFGVFIQLISNK